METEGGKPEEEGSAEGINEKLVKVQKGKERIFRRVNTKKERRKFTKHFV